ncbi:MAG: hypothetical protein OT477_14405 [Chloroflexi bacterium]|nr:hypothetical protein [Chloroflexota bacterium]
MFSTRSTPTPTLRWQPLIAPLLVFATLLGSLLLLTQARKVEAAGNLQITIVAGYNLVVDSNVLSPSTYAPSVATVMGEFCNTGDAPLTNVEGYIGNYTAAGALGGTPGTYPARDSSQPAFATQHPHLASTGNYAFAHVGGRIGTADAARFIGTLNPGECRAQYWHITYPRRGNPSNTGPAVWGETNVDTDDLWLDFDIWGRSAEGLGNDTQNQAQPQRAMVQHQHRHRQPRRYHHLEWHPLRIGQHSPRIRQRRQLHPRLQRMAPTHRRPQLRPLLLPPYWHNGGVDSDPQWGEPEHVHQFYRPALLHRFAHRQHGRNGRSALYLPCAGRPL